MPLLLQHSQLEFWLFYRKDLFFIKSRDGNLLLEKKQWPYFNVLIGKRAVARKPAIASFPSFFFSLTIKEGYFLYSSDINDYIAWKAAAENYN